MSKCKYQLLALKMTDLLLGIDQFIQKTREIIQKFHFYYCEKNFNIQAPRKSKLSFIESIKTHEIGTRILLPSQELHIELNFDQSFAKVSFVKKIDSSIDMKSIIENSYWELLLYCPTSDEYSYEIDWFEKENYTNSLTFQMKSGLSIIGRENFGKKIIRKNLNQLALPHFCPIVEKWQNGYGGCDTIPKDIEIVFTRPFAPIETDYIAHAYEKVLRELKKRSLRNYEHLMILWRDFLENLMFNDVKWTDIEKEKFIKKWKSNIFGYSIKNNIKHDGRWEQTKAIDKQSAGKLIKYFIDKFLTDPSKQKKDGEIACLLWTLIWLAQDTDARGITLSHVMSFNTTNIHKDQVAIVVDGKIIEVSLGLYQLLQVLQGNAQGKCPYPLFPNVSLDYLQYALGKASIILFGENTIPISPAAFLLFPHPMKGVRLSRKERAHLSTIDPGSEAGYIRRQILKKFFVKNQNI